MLCVLPPHKEGRTHRHLTNTTMSFILKTAERTQAKLRIGVNGPAGSGKTYSALLMAYGITGDWSKVALIDTESGSGSLYAHLGKYKVIDFQAPYSPERYIEAIQACEEAGAQVIVIDSTSHEWQGQGGCQEINDKLAQVKFRGNTWSAWSETTPRHESFVQAIVTSSAHIITCTRTKVETVMTEDKKVKKVGMKEIQREGFEYELTVNFNIDREKHLAIASKDRTELFIDRDAFVITPETGKELIEWATTGKEAPKVVRAKTKQDVADLMRVLEPGIENSAMAARITELTGMNPATDDPSAVYTALSVSKKKGAAKKKAVTKNKLDAALAK